MSIMLSKIVALLGAVALVIVGAEAKLKEGDCEVCIASVDKISKSLGKDDKKSLETIEDAVKRWCKQQAHGSKEERFCYYIGGSEHSATTMMRDISTPMKNGLPADRICEKLKPKNGAVCELQFEKEIDWEKVPKMKIKDLKRILANWGEECSGCVEKGDYVKRVQEVKAKRDEL